MSRIATYSEDFSEVLTKWFTLVELLRWRACNQPDQLLYTFLPGEGGEEPGLTFNELDSRARSIGAQLQSLGVHGERVLLLYPPGLEYVTAFFGCLYAGAIAVPLYPPRPNRTLLRIQTISTDAEATIALTTTAVKLRSEPLFDAAPELKVLRWITTDNIPDRLSDEWVETGISKDSLAYLQYTSGSTAAPKGVMVTHENLLRNLTDIDSGFRHTSRSVIVSWLPHFHDMGLIYGMIQPLYQGIQAILMSPVTFLQQPKQWLEAISRYRGTHSGGPNFAYDLCVRKITREERASLDLSSWDVAFNGAEPIHRETLERFAEAFAPCGFRWQAFCPSYGLAEATLKVSATRIEDAPTFHNVQSAELERHKIVQAEDHGPQAVAIVGCGQPVSGTEVVIAHPESLERCGPDEVGEIWVSGPGVSQGYWNRPAETAQSFQAYLKDTGSGPFLRTGDLGFIKDGEVFVTGRLKELIIIRGRNHYPQDIELTVQQSHTLLRAGCGAAFSVTVGNEERLVVVQEVQRHYSEANGDEVLRTIREAVANHHELQVYAVTLIKTGTLLKTSSGKIQRQLCRRDFLTGGLEVVTSSILDERYLGGEEERLTSATVRALEPEERQPALEKYLHTQVARALNVAPLRVPIQSSLSSLGLDSLATIELKSQIEVDLRVVLPPTFLLEGNSLEDLAADLVELLSTEAVEPSLVFDSDRETTGEHPLSYGQHGLWFLHQLDRQSTAYNLTCAVRVNSEIDVTRLRRVSQSLLDRHPVLRTTFTAHSSQAVQKVHSQRDVYFEETDASNWSECEFNEHLSEFGNRPFDLEHGPAFRIYLFKRSTQEYFLLLSAHHIVCDLWSLNLLMAELRALYLANGEGGEASLRMPELQYTDYVHWQAKMLSGAEGEKLWEFWRKQLAGRLPVLNLPTDRSRPPLQTFRGTSHIFKLSDDLTRRLKALAQSECVTLYTTLLAAFQVLLHRYTSEEDILIGTITAGRNRPQFADIVGYFVNPVAIRTDLSGNPSFKALLRRVRRGVIDALAHQDYPFPLVVERLQVSRDPSRSPIFQVVFVWDKPQHIAVETASQTFQLQTAFWKQEGAAFDLLVSVLEGPESLSVNLNYNTDLFDASTIARMAGHFQTLLESIAVCPEQQLSEVAMLTSSERRQLLEDWNETEAEYPVSSCIHHLFEAQVERTPEAIALVCRGEQLSYAQLNARANHLGWYLLRLGVKPETRVGVCLDRSVEMVVALLAVLKAGAAYVPLDPSYPAQRITFMLADAQAPVVLTEARLLKLLPASAAQVICIDSECEVIGREATSNPSCQTQPDNLAYVIYTSGSTGNPKGVAIAHRSAVARLSWAAAHFGPEDFALVLASTSICFDLSVFELFAPLTCGGRVLLVRDALDLPESPAAEQVTLINTVPSAMTELLRVEALPRGVRVVNLAGEALPAALAQQVYQRPQVSSLFNLYGPSEDTTYSTCALVPRDDTPPPIGRPLPNTRLYILSPHGQPTPIGVTGEIHLAGAGLARGYLGRPELTAERFLPDPFNPRSGGRMYRTGDLGRYRSDGQVEFLGRRDHQVKLRGYRIELGEIEAVISQYPSVREVVIVAHGEDAKGPEQLVCYVTPAEVSVEELRRHANERLPAYMVPGVWQTLECLPRTPNGKVNRQALPEPERHSLADPERIGARTPVEEILAGIWSEVLGVGQPGIHDDFFALGGHSLLGTQVVSRVRAAFDVELPLRVLFETPTISSLAHKIEAARQSGEPRISPPLCPVKREEASPLSPAQQRLWFLDQLMPNSAFYNIPVVIRLRGHLDVAALEASLTEVARRHEMFRTRFEFVDGQPTQLVEQAKQMRLEVIDLREFSASREAEAERLSAEEARRPFNLSKGPLWRVSLLRLEDEEFLLLLTMHHIVFDGWSVEVLMREIAALYAAHSTAKPVTLPELPIQYADFVHWQREWLQGEVLEGQLAYWKRQLAGVPPVLELPTDYPRPKVQSYNGATESLVLPEGLVDSLKELSRKEGITLFMTLLAVLQTLLFRYTQQEDIVVGTPVAGRNRVELERLIGFFVNMLALRVDLSGDPTFHELAAQVREVVLEAHAHQDAPFEKLVEVLQPERDMGRSPLFQVMLILQNRRLEPLVLPGLLMSATPGDTGTSKLDLTLIVTESENDLLLSLEYNTDLFKAETIKRMLGHFTALIGEVAARPSLRLSEYSILTPLEQDQILFEWNDTAIDYPPGHILHGLFEGQVARSADAVAVLFKDQSLCYGDLDRRANQLAHHLQRLGVGPEVMVGIFMERSIEMVVALLGTLKAGGAYVPMDPAYPSERLAYVVNDSEMKVIVSQQSLLERLPLGERDQDIKVVTMEGEPHWLEPGSKPLLSNSAGPDNLAYVIYTSGSTGKPKGVGIEHRAVVNFLRTMEHKPGLEAGDTLLSVTSLSFDIAGLELYLPLAVGAKVEIAGHEEVNDGVRLMERLEQSRATVMQATPATWRMLSESGWKGDEKLKALVGGEAIREKQAWELAAACKEAWNMYGPTETTIWSTVSELKKEDKVSIGSPVANTQIYILTSGMQPVPVGVTGELHIGGAGLARGYLKRPDLTAERFIPNPFGEVGGRLYRTGDLARYRPDGAIELIGRNDQQVKIRGFRIELGEIESVLSRHDGVIEAAVVAQKESHDARRLVAFVATDSNLSVAADELRAFLRKDLPEYMIPSAFVMLEALPLTPNGKVDRRALATLSSKQTVINPASVAPRTPIEEVLAKIWADVLDLKGLGVLDNFFDLGGHSLLAARVRSRLREIFQMDLPLLVFFESPSVAQLAVTIESLGAVDQKDVDRIAQLWLEVERLSPEEIEENLDRARQ